MTTGDDGPIIPWYIEDGDIPDGVALRVEFYPDTEGGVSIVFSHAETLPRRVIVNLLAQAIIECNNPAIAIPD